MRRGIAMVIVTAALAVGATALAGASSSAAPAGPQGSLDGVSLLSPTRVEIRGWVSDGTSPTTVAAYIDDSGLQVEARDGRTDVQRFLGASFNTFGYDLYLPISPGVHRVCTYALSQHGGANPLVGCRSIEVSGTPVAHLDQASRVCASGGPLYDAVDLRGWEFDPDSRGGPGIVDAYVTSNSGDTFGVRITVADDRPDVASAYGLNDAREGFRTIVSAKYGISLVRLYAVNTAGNGGNPLFATVDVSQLNAPSGC